MFYLFATHFSAILSAPPETDAARLSEGRNVGGVKRSPAFASGPAGGYNASIKGP
jgi:hypothetical protein